VPEDYAQTTRPGESDVLSVEHIRDTLEQTGINSDKWIEDVQDYTLSGFQNICPAQATDLSTISNQNMRERIEGYQQVGASIEQGLLSLPYYDGPIRRDIRLSDLNNLRGVQGGGPPEPGKILVMEALTSFTRKVEQGFGGNVRFFVNQNYSGASIERISGLPGEGEVLVPSGTLYRITDIAREGGFTNITMEEIRD